MNNIAAISRQYAKENDYISDRERTDLQKAFISGFKLSNDWIGLYQERPPYYKPVNIMYERSEEDWSTTYNNITTAWLAVNDDGEYIWTISGTDIILLDEVVSKWKYVCLSDN